MNEKEAPAGAPPDQQEPGRENFLHYRRFYGILLRQHRTMKAAALCGIALKNTQEGSAYVLGFLILWYYRRGCDPVRLSDDLPYRLGAPSRKVQGYRRGRGSPEGRVPQEKRGGQKGCRTEGQGEGKAAQAAEARGQAEPLPRHQRQGACGHGRQAH